MSVVGEPLVLISKISVTYVCGRRTLCIIGPVVGASITGSITLVTGGLLVPEGILSSSQCFGIDMVY
jgi:hypothetical protein